MSAHLFGRRVSRFFRPARLANRPRARCRRRLTVEPLESRVLLDASGMPGDPAGEVTLDDFSRFESAAELRQHLIDDALLRYEHLFGQPGHAYYQFYDYYDLDGTVISIQPTRNGRTFATNSLSETANGGYSDTNTQVAGVDEGDIVETDGEYLYVLSGEEIVIIDARTVEELHVDSRIEIAGEPFEQFLSGDRLTVLSHADGSRSAEAEWLQFDPMVTVTVLDVSDREAPAVVQQTDLEGRFVDSRTIGDFVYLVLCDQFYLPQPELLPVPREVPPFEDPPPDGLSPAGELMRIAWPEYPPDGQYVYETQEQYLARIEGQVLDLALPHYWGYGPGGELVESGLISGATDIYQPLGEDNDNLTSVVVIDMAGERPGPVSSVSVPMQWTSQIYMSTESLYVLRTDHGRQEEATTIMKFGLDETGRGIDLAAVGSVPGHVLNQFSLDEHEGYLRIATTDGRAGRWIVDIGSGNVRGLSGNNLFVLQQDGQALDIVGSVEGLAPNEKIYSARFMGDRAFVVTYRKVDPLFAIDLSDPTSPYVAGELKVPGFSNYLHPVEGGYLIGIGRDAEVETGLFQDPQVSLFDVNDLTDPQLAGRYTIPTGRVGGQGIFNDHHAIAYFPESGVLAVPIPASEGSRPTSGWGWGPTEIDMWVFRIDPEAAAGGQNIDLLGRIGHDRDVLRSVRIGERLYTISEDTVAVHELLNPEVEIASVHYGETELGSIDFVELEDFDVQAGERRFRFQTRRAGLLALETVQGSSVQAALYDAEGKLLGSLAEGRGGCQVNAGQTLSLRVQAASDDSQLRLANVLERDGSRITIHGTAEADHVELDLASRTVTVNGVQHLPGDGEITRINLTDGRPNDSVVLIGTEADETAELWHRNAVLRSDGLTVRVSGAGTITVHGGGGDDSAVLHDWAGDDRLVQWASGSMIGSGAAYSNKLHDFPTVYARSTRGGRDVARIYDSPGNDELLTKPRFARLSGDGFLKQAEGFRALHVYATAGGEDVARMFDSAGNDTFAANSIGASLFGGGFYTRAKFFEGVHAYATAGGVDLARMFDSPGDDRFVADPTQGAVYGEGFYNRAKFFEGVHAYATAGGRDVASLRDSQQDDIFSADNTQGAMYRPGHYYNRAKHFEEIYADAGAGGQDEARLNNSVWEDMHDRLEADGNWARLSNVELDFLCEVSEFEHVKTAGSLARGQHTIGSQLQFTFEQDTSW